MINDQKTVIIGIIYNNNNDNNLVWCVTIIPRWTWMDRSPVLQRWRCEESTNFLKRRCDTFAIYRGCLICREIYHRLIDVFFPCKILCISIGEIQQLPCLRVNHPVLEGPISLSPSRSSPSNTMGSGEGRLPKWPTSWITALVPTVPWSWELMMWKGLPIEHLFTWKNMRFISSTYTFENFGTCFGEKNTQQDNPEQVLKYPPLHPQHIYEVLPD